MIFERSSPSSRILAFSSVSMRSGCCATPTAASVAPRTAANACIRILILLPRRLKVHWRGRHNRASHRLNSSVGERPPQPLHRSESEASKPPFTNQDLHGNERHARDGNAPRGNPGGETVRPENPFQEHELDDIARERHPPGPAKWC